MRSSRGGTTRRCRRASCRRSRWPSSRGRRSRRSPGRTCRCSRRRRVRRVRRSNRSSWCRSTWRRPGCSRRPCAPIPALDVALQVGRVRGMVLASACRCCRTTRPCSAERATGDRGVRAAGPAAVRAGRRRRRHRGPAIPAGMGLLRVVSPPGTCSRRRRPRCRSPPGQARRGLRPRPARPPRRPSWPGPSAPASTGGTRSAVAAACRRCPRARRRRPRCRLRRPVPCIAAPSPLLPPPSGRPVARRSQAA